MLIVNKAIFLTFGASALFACSVNKETSIDYLGQKPPGLTAQLFSSDVISTDSMEHSAPSFSPDGKIVLWTVLDRNYRASMMEMQYEDGRWSAPHRAAFADSTADDYYPSFSPDGKKLYFSSRRHMPAGYSENHGIRIWQVDRLANGWGTPVPFDTTVSKGENYAHSITSDGTLYFSSSQGGSTNFCLRSAKKTGEVYANPELLPYSINSVGYEDGIYVAPDESFLIFESQRPEGIGGSGDLYISFRNVNGGWNIPVNMGQKVNSAATERFARLSPDGKYLFFGTTRNASANRIGFDIFWIDAAVIAELKKEASAQTGIDMPLGQEIILSLFNSRADSASTKLAEWLRLHPNSLDATVIYSSMLRVQGNFLKADAVLTNVPQSWNENTAITLEKALVKFGVNREEEAKELLEPVLLDGDQLRERYVYLSQALLEMKRLELSDDYFEKAMVMHASPYQYFRRGCTLASMGEKDRAFAALEKAFEYGIRLKREYEENRDLISLRNEERWKQLLGKMNK